MDTINNEVPAQFYTIATRRGDIDVSAMIDTKRDEKGCVYVYLEVNAVLKQDIKDKDIFYKLCKCEKKDRYIIHEFCYTVLKQIQANDFVAIVHLKDTLHSLEDLIDSAVKTL